MFLQDAGLGGVATSLLGVVPWHLVDAEPPAPRSPVAGPLPVPLTWLGGKPPDSAVGVSWGVPWPRGAMPQGKKLGLKTEDGRSIPTQTWPLAFWPDGSLKWSGFAIAARPGMGELLSINADYASLPEVKITVWEEVDGVDIITGPLTCRIARSGATIVESLMVDGREVGRDGRLVVLREDRSDFETKKTLREESYTSQVRKVTVEQSGPIRAVLRVEGMHGGGDTARTWLPFVIRFYFTAGLSSIRIVHSFVFDGQAEDDFISGLGVAFTVPFREERQNRHVRFAGEGDGLWSEPVMMSPGYRDGMVKGAASMNRAQLEGKRIPNLDDLGPTTKTQFETVAVWDAFKLTQAGPDSFAISKRTGKQSSWLHVANGLRARGFVFVGDVSGGLGVGVKHFWEKYPSGLEVSGASTSAADLKIWFWSPEAEAMDLRHYDTIGHEGRISYEDWQPGFSTPHGVANTNELTLWAFASTPDSASLVAAATIANEPPILICNPGHYHSSQTLGVWSLPDTSTRVGAAAETQLERAWNFYAKQVEERRWYGFWDFGDLMRTYDPRRHVWMYDIGGHAWNNTELLPNMWFWFTFLRTGRADAFRLAEAMTRNTSEVDVYHVGRFMGLGSRHNVSHWGCGAKEARISAALLKRYYYYLTTDERTGDLMREVLTVDATVMQVPPLREVLPRPIPGLLRIGPDWLSFASNWMTEWERTGDTRYRDYVLAGMRSIGAMPEAFVTRLAFRYDPVTKELSDVGNPNIGVGEFLDIFGGDQIAMELIQLIDCPEFAHAWNLLCDKWAHETPGPGLTGTRITAYAALIAHDSSLKEKAMTKLMASLLKDGHDRWPATPPVVQGPMVLSPVEEVVANTPDSSQWALNVIMTTEFLRRFQQRPT